MSLLFWLLGAVVVGYIGYTMYLATVLKWEDEQTVGLAYYGLPLAGRNAFKDTLRAHARRLRPLIQFNAKFTKLDFAKSHITHQGVAGPGGSCSTQRSLGRVQRRNGRSRSQAARRPSPRTAQKAGRSLRRSARSAGRRRSPLHRACAR